MNLRTEIKPELWSAISKQYESELYSNAIVEAIHYLSNVIRERANVDGDGIALVGQALGGDTPRLRINKFQTETEKNEQKGIENMLRGIYQGIRNPRSHEQNEDSQSTANAIILFIDYLLGVIGKAKEPFSLDDWILRVFDPNFVVSKRYAELLVSEVPPKKWLEALINIYRKKLQGEIESYRFIYKELFSLIGYDKLGDFLNVVSDELKTTQSDKNIRIILELFPHELWPQVEEIARLRIENKLIQSIRTGKYDTEFNETKGGLGTWASSYIEYFTLKRDISNTLLEKLKSTDIEEQNYVAKYFLLVLPDTLSPFDTNDSYKIRRREVYIEAIAKSLLAAEGSNLLRKQILSLQSWPEAWQDLIIQKLEPLKTSDPPYYEQLIKLKDDFPF